jgi:hypothetical protein
LWIRFRLISWYSFVFDGNALGTGSRDCDAEPVYVVERVFLMAGNNADFPEATAKRPEHHRFASRITIPLVAYFAFPVPTNTTVSAIPDPAHLAQDITFTAAVTATRSVTSGSVEFSDGVGYSASVAV